MAKPGGDARPIIIKRIKKVAGGHHGGAWKIAYADFVTAMMAFFLLMWLLGSTSQGDLKGIADYFNSPLKVAMQGGSGSGDSSSVIQGGGTDLTRSHGQVQRSDNSEESRRRINLQAAKDEVRRRDRARLGDLKTKLESVIDAQAVLRQFKNQIRLDIVEDGLRIQIVDESNRPMFDTGSARLKEYTREILRQFAPVLNEVENRIALSGHTDSTPYASGERGYSNWELSSDRANASRRELVAAGMDEKKIVRVVGVASSVHLVRDEPTSPTNRRISIVVMTREASDAVLEERKPARDVESAADVRDVIAARAAQAAAPAGAAVPAAPAAAAPAATAR